jgi:putative thioredoxin
MAFDFKRDVVDKSFEKPVLIDFWAEWCGPCKILGPVLESLEASANGKWVLVKINTEEEEQIASYFRIQSIPHCKMIYEGKIVDEFTGVQTKETIEKWIDEKFKLLEIGEEVEEKKEDNFDQLLTLQNKIPDLDYYNSLLSYLEANPEHEQAQNTIIKHEIFFKPDQAISRLKSLKDQKLSVFLNEDFALMNEFLKGNYSKKTEFEILLSKIRENLLNGNEEIAMEDIIQAVIKYPKQHDGIARKIGIALFHIWGSSYPITQEYRRRFDMAIY